MESARTRLSSRREHLGTAAPRLTVETGRCLVRANPPITALLKWQRAERGFRRLTTFRIGKAAPDLNPSSYLRGAALLALTLKAARRYSSDLRLARGTVPGR